MEIKFKDVNYIYNPNTNFSKKALSNINLSIKNNKINGILGKSGSGK